MLLGLERVRVTAGARPGERWVTPSHHARVRGVAPVAIDLRSMLAQISRRSVTVARRPALGCMAGVARGRGHEMTLRRRRCLTTPVAADACSRDLGMIHALRGSGTPRVRAMTRLAAGHGGQMAVRLADSSITSRTVVAGDARSGSGSVIEAHRGPTARQMTGIAGSRCGQMTRRSAFRHATVVAGDTAPGD